MITATAHIIPSAATTSKRLMSLDFMRGFIMVLLALDASRLFEGLYHATEGKAMNAVVEQFFHHPWNGLRFWDLIQPGFMYIAGISLALSLYKQEEAGISWAQSFRKVLKRSGWLFFWGVLNYAVLSNGLGLRLSNVLTQLAFTSLISFLIFRFPVFVQMLICVALLFLAELLYRCTNIEGFNQPFTNQHNFGNYVDLVLTGQFNEDGWVSFNAVPTAVHTIAGALTGKLLMSSVKQKTGMLLGWGTGCVAVGFLMDALAITPIIKKIATSSFTIASLGFCLCAYALCYWWIDVLQHRKHLKFFTIVGMNSIFIYLFFEIVGARWFNDYVFAVTGGLMKFINTHLLVSAIISSLCVFMLEWGLCYFLYRKKIFFKI